MRRVLPAPRRRLWCFAAFALATPAAAEPPRDVAPEATPPPAQVSLTLVPGGATGPWRIQIENTGEGPVRIPADPRLLVLELTPPAGSAAADPADRRKRPQPATAGPLRCVLPDDARPSTDDGRELVIPSKRAWSASIDPLFYCFGARERAALVSGTRVTAIFGWPLPARAAGGRPGRAPPPLSPPLAITPVGAAVGKVAPAKAIASAPVTLAETVTITKPSSAGEESAARSVTLSTAEALDVARGVEINTTVTLTNASERPITLYLRPEVVLFTVSGPAGTVTCGRTRSILSPIRELFTTVGVKGRSEVGVLVNVTCPAGTFDEPGIYRVVPRLDTTGVSGRVVGMKTWEGVAVAERPLLLRVRTPRRPAAPPRPALD